MRLTESMLRKIIREEAARLVEMGDFPRERELAFVPTYPGEAYEKHLGDSIGPEIERMSGMPNKNAARSALRSAVEYAELTGRVEAARKFRAALSALGEI